MTDQRIFEAGSFVPFELRQTFLTATAEDEPVLRPRRSGVVLSCDISGFSELSNSFLAKGDGGVDELHQVIDESFCTLLGHIASRGGKPLFFYGDALLSIWDTDTDHATEARLQAIAAAVDLASFPILGKLPLDLNLHLAEGSFQLVEVGGNNDQWHVAAIGSAMTSLQRIGHLRKPNQVIVAMDVINTCRPGAVTTTETLTDAAVVTAVECSQAAPLVEPDLPEEALPYFLSRSPKSVRRWLSSLGLQWVAEQRPVTAILTTLKGFNQAAPDAADRLRDLVRRIQQCVHAQDGAIDNVMIDDKGAAVLSVFGVPPDAHSDDPARGVVSAMDIRDALEEIGQTTANAVSTGRAFCALIGNSHLRSYMVGGDVVTRASRISAAMDPSDGILVDEATMRATESLIGYRAKSKDFALKGIDGPTRAWQVPRRANWTVQDRGFSGRELELGRLRTLWDQVATRKGNAGAIIEGEAGSGKTTLAMVLRDTVVGDGGLFVISESVRINRDIPFSGLRRLTREALGVTEGMPLDLRRRVIETRLPDAFLPYAPLLETLFECGFDDTETTQQLSGRARADALADLLCAVLMQVYGRDRTCLCFEDARWLDRDSRALVDRMLDTAPNLMILILRQTDDDDGLTEAKSGWHRIVLGALDKAGMDALTRSQLGCQTVDPALLSRISEASRGQPFFASEILQGLVDAEAITIQNGRAALDLSVQQTTLPLPHSIFGAVLQRLDRLQPDSQVTLRSASVAGPTFSLGLAVDIHPLRLDAAVAVGHFTDHVHRGFLDALMIGAEQGYSFRHAIVRDVAYSQVPLAARRALHGKIAQWLETNGENSMMRSLPELAHHWAEAGDIEKAIGYLAEEAGRVFRQGFANSAVSVGFQAVRLSGVEIPANDAAYSAAIGENITQISTMAAHRGPVDLARASAPLDAKTRHKLRTLMVLAPHAFQSNRFDVFSWAASTAVRHLLKAGSSNALAFSLYSVVISALTGDRALGAEWSRAALTLDDREGGKLLHAVGFIDTWFHGQWRDTLLDCADLNRRGTQRALETGDRDYASYNVAGEVVMVAAAGRTLDAVIALGSQALHHRLARNSEMHVHLEVQFARALRGETTHPLSLSSADVSEEDKIAWVMESEFVNQIGYYLSGQVRLFRHAGAWSAALEAAQIALGHAQGISGQTAEVDLVFHGALAHAGLILSDPETAGDHAEALDDACQKMAYWAGMQTHNFSAMHEVLALVREGLQGDAPHAAAKLTALADQMAPDRQLQIRASAYEYAARLDPGATHAAAAVAAYRDWGATLVADRLAREFGV